MLRLLAGAEGRHGNWYKPQAPAKTQLFPKESLVGEAEPNGGTNTRHQHRPLPSS